MTETNFDAARKFVEFGLSEKKLGRRESASGPGSSLEAAWEAGHFLGYVIACHGITSILDLGCGDWNWMRHVRLTNAEGNPVSYTGWDANEELVAELNASHSNAHVRFQVRDVIADPYPQVDLIIARDILFHLPTSMAMRVVEKAGTSCSFLLSTSFPSQSANQDPEVYLPIDGWGFTRINLDIEPFGLANRKLASVKEPKCTHGGHERHFGLYGFKVSS